MRKTRYKFSRLALWIISMLLTATGYAQAIQRAIPAAKWQQLTADSAFYYKNEHELTQRQGSDGKFFFFVINHIIRFFGSVYGRITIIILAVSVIIFILYQILGSGYFTFSKKKKQKQTDNLPNEVDISATNWDFLLQDAAKMDDYGLAIRYCYMWLLQVLEEKDLIQYRIDKTNYDYYVELATSKHQRSFKELSRLYEYAWYSDQPILQGDLANYLNLFETFKKQLG